MTNAQAIALPTDAVVRHTGGKLYRVVRVFTQWVRVGENDRQFTSNPLPVAGVVVVGQRNGKDFGPIRTIAADKLTEVN